jgi:hypothetical protein
LEDAITTLKCRFGMPDKIANKTEIVNDKEIKPHSEDEHWSLISELRICNAGLKGKEGMAHDLWSSEKIKEIIQKRFIILETKWSKAAYKINKTECKVTEFLKLLME